MTPDLLIARNRLERLALASGLVLLLAVAATAEEKKEKQPYTLLVGSVFNDAGFSVPGVAVQVRRAEERKPRWRATSDRRGEFAVRLPEEPATYEISTHSQEHQNQTQRVQVKGQPRIDIFFRLSAKTEEEGKDR